MVAIKSNQADSYVKAPDKRCVAFLFFGTDAGLVSERAQILAKTLADRENPPGEVLRLDDTDLETDPDRLAVELRTIPMFGGRKIVRATTGRRINMPALKPLVEAGDLAGCLIVEASGNLKPDDALRQIFEKPAHAAAIACYADEAGDLAAVVRETLTRAGLSIDREAQEALVSRLGADRTLSRGEIEKLALYAHGKSRIEAEDVEAIVGDASELAIDAVVLAAASGDTETALVEFQRVVDSGESAQTIILAAQRHFQRLHRVRAALDAGKSFDDATRTLRPPLFFKQKTAFAAQTRTWSLAQLNAALADISTAAAAARLNNALEDELTERLLLRMAMRVNRAGRTPA